MAKKPQRTKVRKFKPLSWLSPLRAANFALLFAIAGVLLLLFSLASPIQGFYGSIEVDQVTRINNERASHGLNGLSHIECLNTVAENWTKHMADTNTLAHNPNLVSEIGLLCGSQWQSIGENVGVGGGVTSPCTDASCSLFNAFMASPCHKANIDGQKFSNPPCVVTGGYGSSPENLLGLGAYWSSNGKLWITQVFVNCPGCGGNWATPAIIPDDPLPPPPPGNYRENLRNSNTNGIADVAYSFGTNTDKPLPCDWNGNKSVTMGIFRPAEAKFYMRNTNTTGIADLSVQFGSGSDLPICGDWDHNGTDTVGVYRPSNNIFYLSNSNTSGVTNISFAYGAHGDVPVVGDWDGNGTETIGVYRPSNATFYLRNSNTPGFADAVVQYGDIGDKPVVGDWDGNGSDTVGIYRSSSATFYLRNSNASGVANITVQFGNIGDTPLVGDWDGNNTTTVGIWRNL